MRHFQTQNRKNAPAFATANRAKNDFESEASQSLMVAAAAPPASFGRVIARFRRPR